MGIQLLIKNIHILPSPNLNSMLRDDYVPQQRLTQSLPIQPKYSRSTGKNPPQKHSLKLNNKHNHSPSPPARSQAPPTIQPAARNKKAVFWSQFDFYFCRPQQQIADQLRLYKPYSMTTDRPKTCTLRLKLNRTRSYLAHAQGVTRAIRDLKQTGILQPGCSSDPTSYQDMLWQTQLGLKRYDFCSYLAKKRITLSQISCQTIFLEKRLQDTTHATSLSLKQLLLNQSAPDPQKLAFHSRDTLDDLYCSMMMRTLQMGLTATLDHNDWLNAFEASTEQEALVQIEKLKKVKRKRRLRLLCQVCFHGRREQMNEIRTCQCGIKFHVACFSSHSNYKNECQACFDKNKLNNFYKDKSCQYCGVKGYPVKTCVL